ncbi:MAG: ParB/RepB/Spo0J family partition protein [Treponema sp.]|nr:ParB/RepB/Spo0J family partition protein [Treponema sp.]
MDALMHGAFDDLETANIAAENSSHSGKEKSSQKSQSKKSNLPEQIESDESGTLWIDPRILKPNPHQPRQVFDDEALSELADSIREHGVVQPIVIEDAGDGNFFIIAGERRTRASILAEQKKVPVQLRKFNDEKKLEIALIENIQRENLNPIEEAQAYYNLMQLGGLSQDEVAKKVGKGRPTVANALRLLKLPEDMQNSLIVGEITAGHARALLSVLNPADQRVLFNKIVGESISVRQAENIAAQFNEGGRSANQKTDAAPKPKKDADIAALEQKFIEALGTKVQMKGTLEKGSLVVEYFSRADLDRLYEIFIKE